eukprot:symbB.v1.2.017715.t1/scaffold1384.1/size122353/5
MIGNCCKLTVIFTAGNPFVDDRGDYRYQLLDLCPSLRMVDGEEVKGSRPGIQLIERSKPNAVSLWQPVDLHTKYYYPTESAMQWMVNWPSFCAETSSAGFQGADRADRADRDREPLQPRRWMRSSASMPQLKGSPSRGLSITREMKRTNSMPKRFGSTSRDATRNGAAAWYRVVRMIIFHNGFMLEAELLKSLSSLGDFCRRPDATLEELRPWYQALAAGLRSVDFQNFNCSAGSSFHMPLLRLWISCMNWDLLDMSFAEEWREIFPVDLLVFALTHAVRTLRFEAEIQNGLWVRNGQSMHRQQAEYRQRFRQLDLMTVQVCMILLTAEPLACLWSAAFDETPPKSTKNTVPVLERWRRLWSDELHVSVQLRFRLFWTILAQALNEMWPIEVSLCRRKWETRYGRISVILQRFLIQVLAKPMGVSELSALIPKELQVRETQLSEALDQLKSRSWAFFDCCMAEAMPTRLSRELQHDAEEAALQQQVVSKFA